MLARLDIPFVDTDPGQLALSFDTEVLPALSECTLELGSTSVTLRLLGASHQVSVFNPTGTTLIETLACLPDRQPYLPSQQRFSGHRFTSRVQHIDAAHFAAEVAQITATAATAAHGIVGHYPGRPDAVTALIAAQTTTGIAWDSWHTYPQTHQIVVTRTELDLPDLDALELDPTEESNP